MHVEDVALPMVSACRFHVELLILLQVVSQVNMAIYMLVNYDFFKIHRTQYHSASWVYRNQDCMAIILQYLWYLL